MSSRLQEVQNQALELDIDDRSTLARVLIDSLDATPPEELERLWLAEVERRHTEVERGEVEMIPAEQVLHRLRARFG